MHPQVTKLLNIVKRGDAEEIEAARDLVRPELLPELLAAYWQLSTWDDKSGLMQLFMDHFAIGGQEVMLDFLTAPTNEMNDEYYTSGKIAALCQLAGTFEFYERLWYDRPLCAAVIERALAGETPTPALVDALDKPKPAASKPAASQPRGLSFSLRGDRQIPVWGKKILAERGEIVFIIANTAFWIGLLALLLSDPLRMAVGGSLLALALGIYMLYTGFTPKGTDGMAQPGLVRMLAASLGVGATVFAVLMLIHVLRGGVLSHTQTRRQTIRQQLEWATDRTWLRLSGVNLREIPPEVWELEHLTELDLSNNRLTTLPPEIGRLTNLERLYLYNNRLESLPPEIGQLSRLEWLDLDDNRLTTLPPEFARLQSLTHLQIQYNRWETFPDVILELPSLELLFLAGNRLGDLPPSITLRAEAGELDLRYKPYATRFNWSAVVVIGGGLVLPVLLSVVVDRRWMRREQAQQQAARQTGEVFVIPSQLRSQTLFVMFALSAVSLFMLIAALNGPQTGITMQAGVGLCLLFAPLVIGGLIFIRHNTGMVTLTAEGVAIRRLGRPRALRYDEITGLTTPQGLFGPGILIRGQKRALRIPRMLEERPRLYALLLQRVSADVREAALGKTVQAKAVPALAAPVASTADGGPVYAFAMGRGMWVLYIVGVVLFILFYLGIGLLGLWTGLAKGHIPPFTTVWVRNILIFFGMISLLFLPASIYMVHSLFTKYGPFKMERPVAWEFYHELIRYRFPRGAWEERSARTLQRITLRPLPVNVRGGAGIEQEVMQYLLVLEFASAGPLIIDQERAMQFRQTPEQLHALLTELYKVK